MAPLLQICKVTNPGAAPAGGQIYFFQSSPAFNDDAGNVLTPANTGISTGRFGDIELYPLVTVKELRRIGILRRVELDIYNTTKNTFSSREILVAADKEAALIATLKALPSPTYNADGTLANASAYTLKYIPKKGATGFLVLSEHERRQKTLR